MCLCVCVYVHNIYVYMCICIYIYHTYGCVSVYPSFNNTGLMSSQNQHKWTRGVVGSLKLQVSFAKKPYKRDDILQKRPIILKSLLIVATPYIQVDACVCISVQLYQCIYIYIYIYVYIYIYIYIFVCVSVCVCVCVCVYT